MSQAYKRYFGILLTVIGILLYIIPLAYGFFTVKPGEPLSTDSWYGRGYYISAILILIGPALWLGEVPQALVKAVKAKMLGVKGGGS